MTPVTVLLGVIALLVIVALGLLLKLYRQGIWQLHHLEMARPKADHSQTQAEGRAYLHQLLGWEPGTLPPLGGWAASADALIVIAETMLDRKPKKIVEFGSGVTTLVLLRCIELNSTGTLTSYDHDAGFARIVDGRTARLNYTHSVQTVPLKDAASLGWPGQWYEHPPLGDNVDLIVIDGPPALLHPQTRGAAAAATFLALAAGGTILLDDAARAGERAIAERWQAEYPDIDFTYLGLEKGMLIGQRHPG